MRGDEFLAGVVLSLDLPCFRPFFAAQAVQVHAASPSASVASANDQRIVQGENEHGIAVIQAREKAPVSVGQSATLVLSGVTPGTKHGRGKHRVESKATGIARSRARGRSSHTRSRRAQTDSTSHNSLPERTPIVSSKQRRQFTLADFFHDSVARGRGSTSQPTVPGLAHPAQNPVGKQTDAATRDHGRGPMEIRNLGQNDTILTRPHTLALRKRGAW